MRLISLLVGLLIIAYLVSRQLSPESSSDEVNVLLDEDDLGLPELPVAPKDLKNFEKDMNKFIHDKATERSQDLEEIEGALNQ